MLDHDVYTWFAKAVAVRELLVGVGLIVGCPVGFAAFFAALMDFNFVLAEPAGRNPLLFTMTILLILGWKVAGTTGSTCISCRGSVPRGARAAPSRTRRHRSPRSPRAGSLPSPAAPARAGAASRVPDRRGEPAWGRRGGASGPVARASRVQRSARQSAPAGRVFHAALAGGRGTGVGRASDPDAARRPTSPAGAEAVRRAAPGRLTA